MRLLRLLALALLLAAGAAGASAADEPVELKLRAGAAFKGRICSSDDAGLVLKTDDGNSLRLAWKDLDERSWFLGKRCLTDPKDGRALVVLGRFAAEHGWRVDAEQTLALAVRVQPDVKGDADALAPVLRELRRTDAKALLARAKEHLDAKRWLQALGRYRDARDLDPSSAVALNGLGETYYGMRRLKEARSSLEEATRLDPGFKDPILSLAVLDLLELDFVKSLAGLDALLRLPTAQGKVGTPEALAEKAAQETTTTPEALYEKYADPLEFQGRQLQRILREIVSGPGFGKEYRSLTEHYDLRTDVSQEYADLLTSRMELIYDEYDRRFGYSKTGEQKTRGKDLRFPVIVFQNRKGYVDWFTRVLQNPQFARMTGGVYVPLVKHLVFFQGDDKRIEDTLHVAWHEGFHQYLDHFVEGAPHWFNEGQAEYFGGSLLDTIKKKLKPGQVIDGRAQVLAMLLRQDRVPDASWLMQLDAAAFMRMAPEAGSRNTTTVGDHYALAWALVHYCLEGEKGRWQKSFLDYFKALCDGMSHEEAFTKCWSRTPWDTFQRGFVEHCRMLAQRVR